MTGAGNGPIAPSTSAALNAGPVLSPARIEPWIGAPLPSVVVRSGGRTTT